MEIKLIKRMELRSYLGKPVWYQCLEDVNDFGWVFIHPDTVNKALRYCRVIKPDPEMQDCYSWDLIRLYNKPAIRGLCAHCTHWRKDQLIRCELQEQGREPECTFSKQYRDFEPTPYWKDRGYTAKTYIRQLKISGCEIRPKSESKGKEKSC